MDGRVITAGLPLNSKYVNQTSLLIGVPFHDVQVASLPVESNRAEQIPFVTLDVHFGFEKDIIDR